MSGVQSARGARRVVAAGTVLAGAGLVVLATVGQPVVAAVGLVLAAGGISVCWPLLMSEVGRGRARPGMVVGAVSTVGYLGAVVRSGTDRPGGRRASGWGRGWRSWPPVRSASRCSLRGRRRDPTTGPAHDTGAPHDR